jgi:hypothetical protein
MSNSKISALTSAATVAGTEVLPIVQSSATVKVAISDLNPGLSTILATKGGTGQTSYAVGDLLYADTTTTLAKLADIATGNALISGGVGVAPSYGKIGLTTHVSGTLPIANGGTNASTASITSFNNITGYTASGATGTTSTNLVFSTSPSITTPTLVGDVNLSTGNLVIGTAGKGIDFSADPSTAGMTSELLDDYEEGTWTPTLINGTGITYTSQAGKYVKVGSFIYCTYNIVVATSSADASTVEIGGIPFTSTGGEGVGGNIDTANSSFFNFVLLGALSVSNTSTSSARIYTAIGGTASYTNCNASGAVRGSLIYRQA